MPDRWRGGLLRGLAVFALLRYRERPAAIFLYAFDLLEFDGQDLRREPLETRKATLASLLRGSLPGLRLVEHLEALRRCRLPLRLQARLRGHRVEAPRLAVVSGRTRHWLKFKNPAAPAVKREAEEGVGQAMTKFAFGFLYLLWPIFSQPLRPMPQMLGVKISDGVRS